MKLQVVCLLLLCLPVIFGQYGLRTLYSSSDCTGTPVNFIAYTLSSCENLQSTFFSVSLNSSQITFSYFNSSSCDPASASSITSFSANSCIQQGNASLIYSSASSLNASIPYGGAVTTVTRESCDTASAVSNVLFENPNACRTFDNGGHTYTMFCNTTYIIIRNFDGANCSGSFTDQASLLNSTCTSMSQTVCTNFGPVPTTGASTATSGTTNPTATGSGSPTTGTTATTGTTSQPKSSATSLAPCLILIVAGLLLW